MVRKNVPAKVWKIRIRRGAAVPLNKQLPTGPGPANNRLMVSGLKSTGKVRNVKRHLFCVRRGAYLIMWQRSEAMELHI